MPNPRVQTHVLEWSRTNVKDHVVHVARAALPSPTSTCWICSCFRILHRTLTRTTGSLTYVPDHSYACVCTRGLHGHTDNESAQHEFDAQKKIKKIMFFIVLLTGFEPRVFWTSSPTLNQPSTPITPSCGAGRGLR